MGTTDLERVQRDFTFFARMCEGQSPLYATLSPRIAETPAILDMVRDRQPKQSPANLLYGAVNYLMLSGVEDELRAYYPSVGGERPPGEDAIEAFASFCRRHEERIREIASTRRVQTNDVGRCGLLLPGLALAGQHHDCRPLHLVELGCSAGLLQVMDRFRYEYLRDGSVFHRCGPDSTAVARTEVRGDTEPPLPAELPEVAGCVGIDLEPIDVGDDDAVRWVESMIWADQLHRLELFRAAVEIARAEPPRIVEGDGLELVPELVGEVVGDAVPCVFHSHVIYQTSKEWKQAFSARLDDLGRARDLAHVSLEWLLDDPRPQLRVTVWRSGVATTRHLADCHTHGAWMRWLDAYSA